MPAKNDGITLSSLRDELFAILKPMEQRIMSIEKDIIILKNDNKELKQDIHTLKQDVHSLKLDSRIQKNNLALVITNLPKLKVDHIGEKTDLTYKSMSYALKLSDTLYENISKNRLLERLKRLEKSFADM